ncbi:reverse transcriptase [Mycena sanguinolenta]|uniref:Reverse transcriptase n=1 Tax=Mycena sanguinolenta TaxID=230812 RepID=A0A8H6Z5Q3_9AGAR|nr:reverse transcriptase [Mycena sanguinolenta]
MSTGRPSETVKWVGLWLDRTLSGRKHIESRAADTGSVYKPLARLNRSVARCITGSFRTASLAALEKEAAILPAQLRIERDALLTITHCRPKKPKLASILHYVERIPGVRWPPNVPARSQRLRTRGTARQLDEAEGKNVPFDSSLGMEPIFPVYAAPWSSPLPVTTAIPGKEEALRALHVALGDNRRNGAAWYTDGSLLDGRAVPLEGGEVCEGEMEGLLHATEQTLADGHDDILCVADSQAALRGILSTSLRSGQFHAIRYDTLIRNALISSPHLALLNLWTPAHIGTTGYELADAAAKEATTLDPDPSGFISLTSTRRLIHLQILSEWDEAWKRSKTGNALDRRINKSPPSLNPIPLCSSPTIARQTSSTISQLRTGPSHLNAYRFKAGFIKSPECEACGAAYETRDRFLLECSAWESFRKPLYAAAKEAGLFGPLHVSPLLCEPKLLRATAAFIEATGRFA